MALAATALLLGAIAVFRPRPALVIRDDSGAVLRVIPLRGPLALRLEYVHSVERTPVEEHYIAAAGGLRLVRMKFASQGAGLPTSGYVREGGRFVLATDRWLPALSIRVSGASRPRLVIGSDILDLVALAGDGGGLRLQVEGRVGFAFRR